MISQNLIGIALQPLLSGAVSLTRFSTAAVEGGNAAEGVLAQAMNFLQSRFADHSARLTTAIETATNHAWQALELVLAGDSFWDRLKGTLATGDMKAFRHDVRGLLGAAGVDGAYPVDYKAAARELRSARKAGMLQPTGLTPAGMVHSIGVFGRFDNPAELAASQWRATEAVAAELKGQGYPALATVAGFRPSLDSLPLLGVAIRYFFRKAVEADTHLAQGLAFARLESMAEAQEYQFESLNRLITQQGEHLDAALGELVAEVTEVKGVVLDIREEQNKLGNQNRQIMEAVLAMQAKLDQVGRAAVRPQDSLSVRTESDRELVKKVISQYRRLPSAEREARPALQNAVGLLEVAAGDFAAAQSDFAAVAEAVADPVAKGAAHLNAYRAALESRDWDSALRELMAATKCDGRRFAPFPVGKYRPQRILGAGGFGVAFLCKHKYMDAQVVVKTLSGSGLDRDFEAVFTEAQAATAIQHQRIVRVTDCGYTEPETRDRPFVVMDYFPGQALDEYVRTEGVVSVKHLIPLARNVAEALGAAHAKGILHRDVKPGNILVAWVKEEFEARVIDFGLAVQHRVAGSDVSTSRSLKLKTLAGESIAGTIEYAAPEQMSRGSGAKVGPYSDVYGWAKTCCFALFQTTQPTLRHWQGIPAALADLLSRCLEEDPKARLQSFVDVVAKLDRLGPTGEPVVKARPISDSGRPRRLRSDDEYDNNDPPARERRRNRDELPDRIRPREKRQRGGFPIWAGVVIGLGIAFFVAIIAVAIVVQRNSPPGSNKAWQGSTPGQNTPQGAFGVPGFGNIPGQGMGQAKSNWPGGPPSPQPDLPTGWKETKAFGGGFANIEYRDFKQDQSYLIGFEGGPGKFVQPGDIISYLRPIWQTPSGEQFGTSYGKRPAMVWTAKAKEGYALGGAVVVGVGALDSICFTFMRKRDAKTLDPNDYYISEWFGGPSRKPPQNETRAGDGSLLVGIHGTRFEDRGGNNFNDGGAICSIGFVIAPKP